MKRGDSVTNNVKYSPTKQNTYDCIINSSKELFSKHGIDGTSIQDITKKSDISRITFYSYFHNKEELVQEVLFDYFSVMYTFSFNNIIGVNTLITLKNFFKALLRIYLENPSILRFFNNYYSIHPNKNHIEDVYSYPNNIITKLVNQLSNLPEDIYKSYIAKCNAVYQYVLGLGMRYSISSHHSLMDFGETSKEKIYETFDYLLKILED